MFFLNGLPKLNHPLFTSENFKKATDDGFFICIEDDDPQFETEKVSKLLADAGASAQRPLWASTGTKNPAYSDTLYVDTLVGPHTVNTIPPATLDAVLDHGQTAVTVEDDIEEAKSRMAQLKNIGVDMDAITEKLLEEGVDAFAKSFQGLLDSVEAKRKQI